MLEEAVGLVLRDPNTRARLQWVRGWLDEHEVEHVRFQFEPESVAGDVLGWEELLPVSDDPADP